MIFINIYIYLIIYIAFPPWITCESHTENTALYQQKSNNIMETLMRCFKGWSPGFQLSQVLRSHSCICRSPTWRPPPGFLGPEKTSPIRWRKWFPSRWVSGRNLGNLPWNHDYWSKGIYMYNHVHKYICIYMCIYFYTIFIHLFIFIYIYIRVDSTYMHACIMHMHTCINTYKVVYSVHALPQTLNTALSWSRFAKFQSTKCRYIGT